MYSRVCKNPSTRPVLFLAHVNKYSLFFFFFFVDFGFLTSKFCMGLGGLYRGRGDQRTRVRRLGILESLTLKCDTWQKKNESGFVARF